MTLVAAVLTLALSSIVEDAAGGRLLERSHGAHAKTTLCDSVQQYSGYYNLTTGDKHYFVSSGGGAHPL